MSIMNKLVLSCEEATLYVIKKSEGKLGLIGRLQLSIHLAICKFCKAFDIQNELINHSLHHHHNLSKEETLSVSQKDKLKQALKKE